MRKSFESDIQQLKDELLLLGSMVEQSTLGAVEALKKRDIDAARRIYDMYVKINAKRSRIRPSRDARTVGGQNVAVCAAACRQRHRPSASRSRRVERDNAA